MSKPDTWMPLYVADYLADTLHLTRDEHGAYFLLMMAYWRNGGPLLDDDKRLAAIVKASPKEWKDIRPALEEFFTVSDGAWSHKRIDAEIERAQGMVDQRSAAGKASAEKRKNAREAQQIGNENSTSVERPLQREPQRNGKPSPSPIPNPENQEAASTVPTDVATASGDAAAALSADAITVRSTELAVLLFRRGAQLQASDPRVRSWAERGVSDAQALTALDLAKSRRSEQGSPQPIGSGYLDTIIGDLLQAPVAGTAKPAKKSIHDIPKSMPGPVVSDGAGRPITNIPRYDNERLEREGIL